MGPLEWKAYLQECSRRIIDVGEDSGPILPEEAIRSGWLGCDSASSSAIRQAEKRLGVKLPPSFRAFYAVSNGWRTVGSFIYAVPPVEKVFWVSEAEPGIYENAVVIEAEFGSDPRVDMREYAYEGGTQVKRSLAVSSWGEGSTWLLDPGTVSDKGEWAGGRHSSWNPGVEWISDSFEGLFRDECETYIRFGARN